MTAAPFRLAVDGTSYRGATTGAARRTLCLLPELARLGWRPVLATGREAAEELGRALAARGAGSDRVEVVGLPVPPGPGPRRAWRARAALPTILRDRGCALLLTETPPVPGGIPFLLTIHDTRAWDAPGLLPPGRRWWTRRVLPPAARAAAAVVTVSAATARRLRALLPEADLILAPNGSDHLPASSPAPGCFLLAPGPWARHKGLATLLAGWRLLGRNRPRLILTGRPGRRLPPGVEAVQPDDRGLSALLAGAAAVVRPSAFEGFDLPLAEALAAGAPVAASDIPVHRELAGEEAEWFQPGDDEGLATALDRILTTGDDPAARLRRRRRAARFRWAESARILDQALRRLNLAPPSGADSGSPV